MASTHTISPSWIWTKGVLSSLATKEYNRRSKWDEVVTIIVTIIVKLHIH